MLVAVLSVPEYGVLDSYSLLFLLKVEVAKFSLGPLELLETISELLKDSKAGEVDMSSMRNVSCCLS